MVFSLVGHVGMRGQQSLALPALYSLNVLQNAYLLCQLPSGINLAEMGN